MSGIGPRATLEKYDIPVVYENEHVGLHLQDRKSSYITLAGLKDIAGDDTAVIEVLAISEKTWSYMSNKNALGKLYLICSVFLLLIIALIQNILDAFHQCGEMLLEDVTHVHLFIVPIHVLLKF